MPPTRRTTTGKKPPPTKAFNPAPDITNTLEGYYWGISNTGSVYMTEDDDGKASIANVASLGRPYGAEELKRVNESTVWKVRGESAGLRAHAVALHE
jgi:hypothetical protein